MSKTLDTNSKQSFGLWSRFRIETTLFILMLLHSCYTLVSFYLVLFTVSFSTLSLGLFYGVLVGRGSQGIEAYLHIPTNMTCLAFDLYFLYVHSWYFRAMWQLLAWYRKDKSLYWKSTLQILIRDLINLLPINCHQTCLVSTCYIIIERIWGGSDRNQTALHSLSYLFETYCTFKQWQYQLRHWCNWIFLFL